jgi:hypothetical protein
LPFHIAVSLFNLLLRPGPAPTGISLPPFALRPGPD